MVSANLFHGSSVTREELLGLAEFLAPSTHFISAQQLQDSAASLAEWADEQPDILGEVLDLAAERHCRRTVIDVLRAAGSASPEHANALHLRAS
jgi:hypothetical protein